MGHMLSGSSSYSDLYNPYFEGTCMVNQIYPPESLLNGANASDAEPPFLTHIYQLTMVLCHQIILISEINLILILLIYPFWVVSFPVEPHMDCKFHN